MIRKLYLNKTEKIPYSFLEESISFSHRTYDFQRPNFLPPFIGNEFQGHALQPLGLAIPLCPCPGRPRAVVPLASLTQEKVKGVEINGDNCNGIC